MKKFLAILLSLLMGVSFCACTKSDPAKFAGKYQVVSSSLDCRYILNENTTYEIITPLSSDGNYDIHNIEEKGVFQQLLGGGFSLVKEGETHSSKSPEFSPKDKFFYLNDAYFDKDTEYGLEPTFDSNGKSNQHFSAAYETLPNDAGWKMMELKLNDDGTFVLYDYIKYTYQQSVKNKHEGTYHLSDDILCLTYDNKDHTMFYMKDKIYFYVIEKIN